MNLLIADSGATKTDWALIRAGREASCFRTQGLNPYFTSGDEFRNILAEVTPNLDKEAECRVYFYGAGCGDPGHCEQVKEHFRSAGLTNTEAGSDLLGAARAVLQHERGIACILGTGANAGLYDGRDIVRTSPSLGFILGDEGSGAWLGKQLVTAYLRHELPAALHEKFSLAFAAGRNGILRNIYTEPHPSAYLATFAAFFDANRNEPWINALLVESYSLFFWKFIFALEPPEGLLLGFTGAIADRFADIITEVAATFGFPDLRFESSPIKGLVKYHSE
jgi:glucosamine kinase